MLSDDSKSSAGLTPGGNSTVVFILFYFGLFSFNYIFGWSVKEEVRHRSRLIKMTFFLKKFDYGVYTIRIVGACGTFLATHTC